MLEPGQEAQLHERGWTTVPGVLLPANQAEMHARVWDFFEGRGLRRDDPDTWPDSSPKLQALRNARIFDPFLGPTVDAIADQLIGPDGWTNLDVRPQALVTMPTPGPWRLPYKVWHLDLPGRGPTETFGAIRFIGLVTDVGPQGGSTLVVEGSHEIVRRMVATAPENNAGSSSKIRKRLSEHEFFERLGQPDPDIRTFMREGDVIDGVHVRVAELTGNAGDLVVMHPWLLHNLSTNASDQIRIAMSYSLYTKEMSFYG